MSEVPEPLIAIREPDYNMRRTVKGGKSFPSRGLSFQKLHWKRRKEACILCGPEVGTGFVL